MKTLIGAFGWAICVVMTIGLSSCDDTKATCTKMCSKMTECLPAQLKKATEALPGGGGEIAKKMEEEMKKEFEKSAEECKKKCDDGDIKDTDKKEIEKVKACLDKDCDGFMKCLEQAAK